MARAPVIMRLAVFWLIALRVMVSEGATEAADFNRHRWALLIGVGEFERPEIAPLRLPGGDVEAVRDLLVGQLGFESERVVTLQGQEATKRRIMQQLSHLTDPSRVDGNDSVLIYFSGHGQTVPLPRGGEMGFLVPRDAQVDLRAPVDPAAYYDACIGMDELRRLASLIPARHVLFLVDACCSGLAIEAGRDFRLRSELEVATGGAVRQMIAAGLKDEKATESPELGHSAFTHCLLDALGSGTADLDRDGVVTGLELATHMRSVVPSLAPQTPQYRAFGGDGEYLFELPTPVGAAPTPGAGPLIFFTGPAGGLAGVAEVVVAPVGGEVQLQGLVLSERPDTVLTIDGRPVPLSPVAHAQRDMPLGVTRPEAMAFVSTVQVGPGQQEVVALRARDGAGRESSVRMALLSEADDTQAPELVITEVRTYSVTGTETSWQGLSAASEGLTVAPKGLTVASKSPLEAEASTKAGRLSAVAVSPRERASIFGFARDDRAVVSVQAFGRPAQTRPALRQELAGLGWASGTAFEGEVSLPPGTATEVVVTASDAAGNQGSAQVWLEPSQTSGPEIIILDPPQTRGIRGTGIVVPKSLDTMRIAGLARAGSTIVSVTIARHPAQMRPAAARELVGFGWTPPATYFELEVPVSATGVTERITVEAMEEEGGRTAVAVLVQRPGPPLEVAFAAEHTTYRVGDRVHFLLSADRECYLYLWEQRPDGSLTAFLPNPVESDCLLRGGVTRMVPSPVEERRWTGQYGLMAQEPTGTHAAYSLALPGPLFGTLPGSVTDLGQLANALAANSRLQGVDVQFPEDPTDDDIERAVQQLGGSWQVARYGVTR